MKSTTVAIMLALVALTDASAETTIRWWGLTAFRQRHEISKDFIELRDSTGAIVNTRLNNTIENSTTKVGYQFGFLADVRENVTAGLTLRSGLSGLGQVMLQDVNNKDGLVPSVQEAYINWRTPFFKAEFGKIPQKGNALWDVYVSTLIQKDFRQDDPRDGIFDDRLAALNGIRLSRSFGPVALRALYHVDDASGAYRKTENAPQPFVRTPDRYVFMLGTTIDLNSLADRDGTGMGLLRGISFDFDYGFPHRAARVGTNLDSLNVDETLYGLTLKRADEYSTVQVGYAYNWRDSVFTITYLDILAQANIGNIMRRVGPDWGDFTLSARIQNATQELEFIPYKGYKADRNAFHIYANKSLWGLDFQPRAIWFDYQIEGYKLRTQARYEITTTVRF